MKKTVFTGVCTALVTPFINGAVNYPMLQVLLRRQIDAGIPAVAISGTTGEAPTLSFSEKIELFRRAKEYTGDHCTIIAGTGTNCTKQAIELSKSAEAVGADAVLVVSPYYNKANAEGLYAHYVAIAQSVSIPVIIYNVPSRTGVDIPVSVYKHLSQIPNIAGVKEAGADITKITKIRAACDPSFRIWSGNDDQIVPVTSLGGQGVISVLSNVLPAETAIMTNAALSGDYVTAAALQQQLQPLVELLFCDVNPIPVKTAMKMIGYDCGDCRLPLTALNAEKTEKMRAYFAQ